MVTHKAGLMPCPSCNPADGALEGEYHRPKCKSLVLTYPHETDGRFNEVDARRIVAAWNFTRGLPLENLEQLAESIETGREEEEGDVDDEAKP